MNTGALVYAFSGDIDYVKIAAESAKRIKRHLNIPVTLVTDTESNLNVFDTQIIVERNPQSSFRAFADREARVKWFNRSRCTALEITPYDYTLLVDADYWIGSPTLLPILEKQPDFCAYKKRQYTNESEPKTEKFGIPGYDMWWATVCGFSKNSKFTNDVFDSWQMIEDNYAHYANVFNFSKQPFRNDYALSIALYIAAGHRLTDEFFCSWPLFNSHASETVQKNAPNSYNIVYHKTVNKRQKLMRNTINDFDIHVMNKLSLENIIETDL